MELKSNKRTLESIRANATKGKYGCNKAPLFDIGPNEIIADKLHLLLRIMDVLIQGLIDTAVAHDHHSHMEFVAVAVLKLRMGLWSKIL